MRNVMPPGISRIGSNRASLPSLTTAAELRFDQPHEPTPDLIAWPVLWARCWGWIRTWPVPPRWSRCDWCDEACAQGALAACLAHREFDPGHLVPLDAFLYRRVVQSVWTRYRQEWSFGRRERTNEGIAVLVLPAVSDPDLDLLQQVGTSLERLSESDRRLIRQLFWDGLGIKELADASGLSREVLKKRKNRALKRLRKMLEHCL